MIHSAVCVSYSPKTQSLQHQFITARGTRCLIAATLGLRVISTMTYPDLETQENPVVVELQQNYGITFELTL